MPKRVSKKKFMKNSVSCSRSFVSTSPGESRDLQPRVRLSPYIIVPLYRSLIVDPLKDPFKGTLGRPGGPGVLASSLLESSQSFTRKEAAPTQGTREVFCCGLFRLRANCDIDPDIDKGQKVLEKRQPSRGRLR